MDEVDIEIARDAAKFVKRALALTVLCSLVAIALVLIDQGIKRQILDAAARARTTLDEITRVAAEVKNRGTQETGEAGAGGSGGVGAGAGLVDDAGAGTVLDPPEGAGDAAPAVSEAGVAAGPPGDG